MKSYITLVGELAGIRIQNYAGLLASKLAYLPKNWLILTKLANCPISQTESMKIRFRKKTQQKPLNYTRSNLTTD